MAEELEDHFTDKGNSSPERTSKAKLDQRRGVFEKAYLSPSEVLAEMPSLLPTETLYDDPRKDQTPVLFRGRCGRKIHQTGF